ncbi:MAG: hypothetical protein PUG48_12220 [Clostridia bacterium]|nr:hypothetical protein [Clostridia bacterium]
MRKKNDNHIISEAINSMNKVNCCPRCGSSNISFNLALEEKERGSGEGCFLSYIVMVLLLFIPVLGWILLFAMFHEKKGTVRVTYALCNNCGNSWKFAQQDSENNKKTNTKFIGLLIFILLIFIATVALYSIAKSKNWI